MNNVTATGALPGESKAIPGLVSFLPIAGGLLLITGAAKLWSAFGSAKLLAIADPIVGIQFRYLLLAVGAAEAAVAFVCLFTHKTHLATLLVAWLSTGFLLYRLGLWWIKWESPCACLGRLTNALPISPQWADNIMKVVLAYLLVGSYVLLFRQRQRSRAS
jgi:hypothetical protein